MNGYLERVGDSSLNFRFFFYDFFKCFFFFFNFYLFRFLFCYYSGRVLASVRCRLLRLLALATLVIPHFVATIANCTQQKNIPRGMLFLYIIIISRLNNSKLKILIRLNRSIKY